MIRCQSGGSACSASSTGNINTMIPATVKHHYELKEENRQVILRRSDNVGSLTIWGHNNHVMFEAGTSVPLLIVNGFDNILIPITESVSHRTRSNQH